ncbi:MAG: hypothetical protein H6640_21395 [Caldilineaceae bacterium]|nr:hypothetical protein [Caldilineaceae bacterium]
MVYVVGVESRQLRKRSTLYTGRQQKFGTEYDKELRPWISSIVSRYLAALEMLKESRHPLSDPLMGQPGGTKGEILARHTTTALLRASLSQPTKSADFTP